MQEAYFEGPSQSRAVGLKIVTSPRSLTLDPNRVLRSTTVLRTPKNLHTARMHAVGVTLRPSMLVGFSKLVGFRDLRSRSTYRVFSLTAV